jgi:ribosome-binding factor A
MVVMSGRMRRVNESVLQTLSEALPSLKDPRIGFVTVTAVRVTPDLRQARVYVSVLGSEKKIAATVDALNAAHGVLQARLNRELRIKRIPQLTFEYDPTAVEAVRMTKLIEELAPEDEDEDRDES